MQIPTAKEAKAQVCASYYCDDETFTNAFLNQLEVAKVSGLAFVELKGKELRPSTSMLTILKNKGYLISTEKFGTKDECFFAFFG